MPQTPRSGPGSDSVTPQGHLDAFDDRLARISPSAPRQTGGLARNSAFGTLAGLATALGSVLGSVIVAHRLGVESTGVVMFALWVVSVAAAVTDFGVQHSLSRYIPELIATGRGGEAVRLATVLRRPAIAGAAIALAAFVAYALWQDPLGSEDGVALWVAVGVGCALQTLAAFCYGRLRGEQRFGSLALVTITSMVGQLAGIAVGSLMFGVPGALAGYCVGNLLPALLALGGVSGRAALGPQLRGRVVRYALYAWAASLSSAVVWSRAEVFFLQRSSGSAAVGLFSVGVTLANVAAQGPMLLTSALLPHFAQSFGRRAVPEMRAAYATATRLLAFLVFPACFGLAALLPALIPAMYGSAFAGAIPAATVLVLAAGIGATSSVGTSLIMAMDRSDFVFASGVIAATLTVLAGLTIIPAFGLIGAAGARATTQTAAVAFGSWFIMRRLDCPLPLRDIGKLLLAAILCGASARLFLFVVPGPLSLPAAVAAGAAAYVAGIRALRPLPREDLDRLRGLGQLLPGMLLRPFEFGLWLVGGIAAARAAAGDSASAAPGSACERGPRHAD